jgi:hypothetical protein
MIALPPFLLVPLWLSMRGTDPHGGGLFGIAAFSSIFLSVLGLLIFAVGQSGGASPPADAAPPASEGEDPGG